MEHLFNEEKSMKVRTISTVAVLMSFLFAAGSFAQERNYNPSPMIMDVGNFYQTINKQYGDGGIQSQFSWNLTGANPQKTEQFYWPADFWQSNMLYQIFNPISLDDNGIVDIDSVRKVMYAGRGDALTNFGMTDWAMEIRRYPPPQITVDGTLLTPPYRGHVDRSLPVDQKIEFEDVCPQFGFRSHVEIFSLSNPLHGDYYIWKATQKFTGEIKRPREAVSSQDSLPDQTVQLWWPISFSFGPSKVGERAVLGGFSFEGEDDLDSWFKRKSELVTTRPRDTISVAYYYDWDSPTASVYTNGSGDDAGDPDRTTGYLHSWQIPGFALLYADKSPTDRTDDVTQPYAMPHATITGDLWGRRDGGLKLTYRGDDARGRFPLDPITAGLASNPEKGPMRFITVGPYTLTKDARNGRFDEFTFVLAVGAGGIGMQAADSIGNLWFTNQISDSAKNAALLQGVDSLWKVMDRANWAWTRISAGQPIAAAPPAPDIQVNSGPDRIEVAWSYPDASYFQDATTGVDDWYAWRIYRKAGTLGVNDPLDRNSKAKWELIHETTNKGETRFFDTNVQRGVDYYYAVTAVDNGTQGTDVIPGLKLESSRYATRSQLPATSFKPGLNESGKVRVVPNPATVAAGALGFEGTPDKILFVNLPVECELRIYTETGDLVRTMQHFGTADEEWDQRTDGNQLVSSGIYVLAVLNAKDINGKALDNQFVKFVLVR